MVAAITSAAMMTLAVHAQAVTITNVTTNTVVFHDDFESGNFLSPSAGTWTIPSDVTVISSTTPPNPGPAEGTFYARSFRDTQFVSGQGNMFANLSAAQTNPGDLIRMSAMLYVPDDGANARATFALDNGNAGTNGRAIVRSDGTGNVIALGPGLASQDTGLDYIPDAWQWWELEYAVGSATFSVRVNGLSAGPFTSFTSGPVNTGEIFNGAFDPAGSIFVDAGDSVNIIGNTAADAIDLSSLVSTSGSIDISGNTATPSIDLGSLASVGGDISITDNPSATAIDLSSLVSASGNIDISGNSALGLIDLPNLVTAGGDVSITDNTSADAIDLSSLVSTSGNVDISGNTSATTVQISSLASVGGNFTLSGNAGGATLGRDIIVAGTFLNNGPYIQSAGSANLHNLDGVGDTTVSAGATLIADHIRQDSLTLAGAATIRKSGAAEATSTLNSLTLTPTAKLDLNNNDLVVRATAATKDAVHGEIEADIIGAQNGLDANLVTKWDGPGITSSTARTNNVVQGFDLTGLGVIRNSDLNVTIPGSAYTSFSGQAVTPDDVLVKYTYVGDANLSGAVSFDDYVGMDNAFFGLIPNLGWATGDINFDNVINFDDYSKVDQAFFFQGAPLSSVTDGPTAIPEPGTLALALAGLLVFRVRAARPGTKKTLQWPRE